MHKIYGMTLNDYCFVINKRIRRQNISHTHTPTHARTHARTHAHTHTHTQTHTHANTLRYIHTNTHKQRNINRVNLPFKSQVLHMSPDLQKLSLFTHFVF